jgi:uncharacterized membrane protein YkvA (DUF1232 family)
MLKKELLVLYYAIQDRRTGIWSKLTALASVLYLLNPMDLIPDFIPFFGWMDDLLIVPLLLNLAIRLLPAEVREESLARVSRRLKNFQTLITPVIILFIALAFIFLLRLLLNKK